MASESRQDQETAGPTDPGGPDEPGASQGSDGPPIFQHPRWMVGVVLIFAVLAIIAGFDNWVWWLIGSPCILVLVVYVWVRLATRP